MAETIGIILSLVVCTGFLVYASVKDIRTRRIPIWIFPTMGISGFLIRLATGSASSPTFFYSSLLGMVIMGFIMIIVAAIGGAGGADVLMMGAIGLVMGIRHALEIIIISYIPFVVYSVYIFCKEKQKDIPKDKRTKELPFVPFVTFGFVADIVYNVIVETLR